MDMNSVSELEFNQHLALASSTENYFTFRECYLEIMSRDAALLLQKMINYQSYLIKRKKLTEDGFFPFTSRQAEKSLKMSPEIQRRVLLELQGKTVESKNSKRKILIKEEMAFIKVRKGGGPPAKRFVKINYIKLSRAIGNVSQSSDTTEEDPLLEEEIIPNKGTSKSPVMFQGTRLDLFQGTQQDMFQGTRPILIDESIKEEYPKGYCRPATRDRHIHQSNSSNSHQISTNGHHATEKASAQSEASKTSGKNKASSTKRKIDPTFLEWADDLHTRAEKLFRGTINYNRFLWANCFCQLAKTFGRSRISKVVDYYLHHKICSKDGAALVITHPRMITPIIIQWIESVKYKDDRNNGLIYDDIHPDMI